MTRLFHATMAIVVLATLALSAWGMATSGVRVPPGQLIPKLILYGVVLAAAAFYHCRGVPQFVAALLVVFWMGVVSDLHVFPMFLAGRQPAEFQDTWLAQIDSSLGLEVPAVLDWVARHPMCKQFLDWIYGTLVYLMACAILVTSLCHRLRAAQEYILSCVAAVLICFPFFAFFQAVGPWVVYGYQPTEPQTRFMQVFTTLKVEEVFVMDLSYVNGLLCFPSFHTILAVLAAVALWSIPYARWLTALWAGLIVVSTVTTGWHYIIDVVTGAAIASVCVCLAKVYTRLECKWLTWRRPQSIPVFEVPTADLNPAGCVEDYGNDGGSYVTSSAGRFCTSGDSR